MISGVCKLIRNFSGAGDVIQSTNPPRSGRVYSITPRITSPWVPYSSVAYRNRDDAGADHAAVTLAVCTTARSVPFRLYAGRGAWPTAGRRRRQLSLSDDIFQTLRREHEWLVLSNDDRMLVVRGEVAALRADGPTVRTRLDPSCFRRHHRLDG